MSLSAHDEFLHVIAHQARVAYATQQLSMCRKALQAWQANAPDEIYDRTHMANQLADYTRQIAHWQDYLGSLGAMPNLLRGCEMPLF
ncbi:MAG TPA: hypothetical protein VFX76_22210 [Roseiflexaceae bacterium]|nr:hypothetical protein [Roseiflexaceae bacterium]